MSKRSGNKKNRKPDIAKEANYYKLKTKAVKDLVEADESNSPEVSEEELNKYRSGPKLNVADWVKLLLLKWWFAGAVCFFFIWGLSGYMSNMLDTLFVTEKSEDLWWYDGQRIMFRTPTYGKILNELLTDSHPTYASLQEATGVNRSALQKMLQTMIEKGYIERYEEGGWRVFITPSI